MKRILFVCTGNSCRSVMAKYLLEDLLRKSGVDDITVDSAGVFALEGLPATQETKQVLQQAGLDCSGHFARGLTTGVVESADLILAMEPLHVEEILRRMPSAKGKVHLLKRYGLDPQEALQGSEHIPDPIAKPLEVYEVCFATIREAVERVARSLGVNCP